MVGKFRDKRSVVRVYKESIRGGPNKHVQGADKRDIHQQPGAKRLGSETNFLQHPPAEILQSENVTTPAADKTPEDQRRQNR
ncbi:MAG: hypothetical protein DME93_09960 [Verrucomicrobia bacterium]|nr:MAG: hypothetical protein DME93_09960 [Verrucomicrobiota bacterium]